MRSCLQNIFTVYLGAVLAIPTTGYFLGDSKAVLSSCADRWTLQDKFPVPLLLHMTVCVHLRVVVPGTWTAFSYHSPRTHKPELGLQGDQGSLYAWLLGVRRRFPMGLKPMVWHIVCLRRDVRSHSFTLEVDDDVVAVWAVVAQAIPPSGVLRLGCQASNKTSAARGEVELYLFRMWDDLEEHEQCEDGSVIGWDSNFWGMTSANARQTDPNLPCDSHRGVQRQKRNVTDITSVSEKSFPKLKSDAAYWIMYSLVANGTILDVRKWTCPATNTPVDSLQPNSGADKYGCVNCRVLLMFDHPASECDILKSKPDICLIGAPPVSQQCDRTVSPISSVMCESPSLAKNCLANTNSSLTCDHIGKVTALLKVICKLPVIANPGNPQLPPATNVTAAPTTTSNSPRSTTHLTTTTQLNTPVEDNTTFPARLTTSTIPSATAGDSTTFDWKKSTTPTADMMLNTSADTMLPVTTQTYSLPVKDSTQPLSTENLVATYNSTQTSSNTSSRSFYTTTTRPNLTAVTLDRTNTNLPNDVSHQYTTPSFDNTPLLSSHNTVTNTMTSFSLTSVTKVTWPSINNTVTNTTTSSIHSIVTEKNTPSSQNTIWSSFNNTVTNTTSSSQTAVTNATLPSIHNTVTNATSSSQTSVTNATLPSIHSTVSNTTSSSQTSVTNATLPSIHNTVTNTTTPSGYNTITNTTTDSSQTSVTNAIWPSSQTTVTYTTTSSRQNTVFIPAMSSTVTDNETTDFTDTTPSTTSVPNVTQDNTTATQSNTQQITAASPPGNTEFTSTNTTAFTSTTTTITNTTSTTNAETTERSHVFQDPSPMANTTIHTTRRPPNNTMDSEAAAITTQHITDAAVTLPLNSTLFTITSSTDGPMTSNTLTLANLVKTVMPSIEGLDQNSTNTPSDTMLSTNKLFPENRASTYGGNGNANTTATSRATNTVNIPQHRPPPHEYIGDTTVATATHSPTTINVNTTAAITIINKAAAASTTSPAAKTIRHTDNEPGVSHASTVLSNDADVMPDLSQETTDPTTSPPTTTTTGQTSAISIANSDITMKTPGGGNQTSQDELDADDLLCQTNNVTQLNISQVEELVGKLENLLDGPSVSHAVAQKTINVISNLMAGDTNSLSTSSNRLVQVIGDLGVKLAVLGDSAIVSSKSLALLVLKVDRTMFPGTSITIRNTSDFQVGALGWSLSTHLVGASMFLAPSLTAGLSPEEQRQASRVQFTFYTKASLFQDITLNPQKNIIGPVLGCSVSNLSISNLSENVLFTIQTTLPVPTDYNGISCVFWDFKKNGGGGWSDEGCVVVNTTSNYTTCSCNHLTSFAILLDLSKTGVPVGQEKVLTYITYIGCGVSAIFLSITLLTYLCFQKLMRDIPAKILVQLCLSLLLLNMIFLLDGWLALFPVTGLCISTAFFLHYFLLTSFTWAGLEALHMYLSIVKVFTPYLSRYMLKFSLVGWGLPLMVVIPIISVDKNNYGLTSHVKNNMTTADFCWLRSNLAFYVGVVAYFLLIFTLSLLVFIVVLVQLARIKRQNPQNQSPQRGLMTDLRSVFGLMVLLGLTWGFALLGWGPLYLPFLYLFSIFNSLQGFFIFVFHCAFKENVRRQWRTHLCFGTMRLTENTEWSLWATYKMKESLNFMPAVDVLRPTSRSSSIISDITNASGSLYADSGISFDSHGDVVLNEIHRRTFLQT